MERGQRYNQRVTEVFSIFRRGPKVVDKKYILKAKYEGQREWETVEELPEQISTIDAMGLITDAENVLAIRLDYYEKLREGDKESWKYRKTVWVRNLKKQGQSKKPPTIDEILIQFAVMQEAAAKAFKVFLESQKLFMEIAKKQGLVPEEAGGSLKDLEEFLTILEKFGRLGMRTEPPLAIPFQNPGQSLGLSPSETSTETSAPISIDQEKLKKAEQLLVEALTGECEECRESESQVAKQILEGA